MTELAKIAAEVMAAGLCSPRPARDPVNQPMINNWTEAMGDTNSRYVEWEAPPAMVQVWTMRGLHPVSTPDDPLQIMSAALDDAGYTSVVATNCEQTYLRYLRLGEELTVRTRLESYSGPKKTALGEGWFFTTESTWFSGDEPVATMLFRVLKFKPAARSPQGKPIRPMVTRDTEFFWDGAAAGELRIQQCTGCGVLRHPPGPMCPSCGATKPGYVVASGTGTVYSYVTHHHPPVPGKQLPFVVALVELPEGVRVMAELREVDPATVHVGMPVQVGFLPVEDFVLPVWHPLGYVPPAPAAPPVSDLPELTFDVTPTFVVSTALATRDFQDVHHDRDLAVSRGSKDIFLNILTTTGLVQRFVTDWAGPEAEVRRIAIKLGVPCYAYEKLTFTGIIKHQDEKDHVIEVTGRNSLGAHVTGTVEVTLP
jgi:uncharacterized OB-fold protein